MQEVYIVNGNDLTIWRVLDTIFADGTGEDRLRQPTGDRLYPKLDGESTSKLAAERCRDARLGCQRRSFQRACASVGT